jgi:hypothetical protein
VFISLYLAIFSGVILMGLRFYSEYPVKTECITDGLIQVYPFQKV